MSLLNHILQRIFLILLMEKDSSSDALDSSLLLNGRPTETGFDNIDESRPNILILKARFYELYGEHFRLKAQNTILGDQNIAGLLVEGKNTIKVIVSDLNINDFKSTVPYFDQKRIVSEESIVRADRELRILESINIRIRKRLEELDQLESYSI